MKILVPKINSDAMKWIYDGYARAWEVEGFTVERYDKFCGQESDLLMLSDRDLYNTYGTIDYSRYEKVFLFSSFNEFEAPYNSHLNYVSNAAKNETIVNYVNEKKNIVKWTLANSVRFPDYYKTWEDVKYVPLAYDDIHYKAEPSSGSYDVSFVGGVANNGFNTKIGIMKNIFEDFSKSGLKCGFFINKNLTHEEECRVMTNSKVCLNIHDSYQREIGTDVNERTFKALGLNGNMISDYVEEGVILLSKKFFHRDSKLVEAVKEVMDTPEIEKAANRAFILENHTYKNRVRYFKGLI